MKSKLFSFTAALFTIALVASCAKLDKVLVKKDGKWNISSYSHKETINGTVAVDTTMMDFGSVTFTDDGKGTFIFGNATFGMDTSMFTWTATEETVSMTDTSAGATPTVWNVDESSKNDQTWSNSENDSLGSFPRTTADKIVLARVK